MSKPTPISGFPEWLPPQRMIEQYVLDRIRAHLRAVRLRAAGDPGGRAAGPVAAQGRDLQGGVRAAPAAGRRRTAGRRRRRSGLHFDLTVPFARYVLENAGKLQFPFRRYQIQKVWRGERPQEGRYREFLQADIDVVDRDTLPLALRGGDAAGDRRRAGRPARSRRCASRSTTARSARASTAGSAWPTRRRRCARSTSSTRSARTGWPTLLVETAGATEAQAKACLALAEISADGRLLRRRGARARGRPTRCSTRAWPSWSGSWRPPRSTRPGCCVADLQIARGLDYYTGTVYETQLRGYERFGSICSGGRYDNLASAGTDRFPGVGISIGVTRLLGLLFGAGALSVSAVGADLRAGRAAQPRSGGRTATGSPTALRRRGIPTEVSPSAAKFGKQIRYAERRGIPYVWFPGGRRARRGQGHPLRRAGARRPGRVDPASGGPQAVGELSLVPRDLARRRPPSGQRCGDEARDRGVAESAYQPKPAA